MAKRIFVVEDDHACETILRRTIKSIDPGSRVDWVESAEQATTALRNEKLAGNHYDLIIADIFLDGKTTGLELWKDCARQFPETPVLITSGVPVDQFLEMIGRKTIAPPFLAKPYYIGECRQVIEGLLA